MLLVRLRTCALLCEPSAEQVDLIWKALKQGFGPWADRAVSALIIAGVIGLLQFLPILKNGDNRPGAIDISRAALFGALNSLVLWAAALGVDEQLP